MATLGKGYTFGSTEQVTNEKLHNLVDDGTVSSIMNADVSASAAIIATKLNLSTIAEAITFTGNNTFSGTTIADLGTVTTADINGGSLDNVNIGSTTATGELFVNNSSDYAVGLGSQGTAGQVLTSAGAGANPTWVAGVPSGVILMWSGAISEIPTGWVICDGTNGTPDLTDRFVLHADADGGGTNNVGDTGGASTHALSIAELAAHTHPQQSNTLLQPTTAGVTGVIGSTPAQLQGGTTQSTGSGTAHTNRDKYHALAYIMKT